MFFGFCPAAKIRKTLVGEPPQTRPYYGSAPLREAYIRLHDLYEEQGLTQEEIDEILVLDIKGQEYFTERGYSDQHAGGAAFAFDEEIMGWLFAK